MKLNLAILSVVFLSTTAFAVPVTLTGPDEILTGDTKICVYEGHGISRTYEVAKSEHCPFAKTFETDEDE